MITVNCNTLFCGQSRGIIISLLNILLRLASSLLYLLTMELLSYQQIKKEELLLLETPGLSLADYSNSRAQSKLFKEFQNFAKIGQLQRLKIESSKSVGSLPNSNITAFVLALLTSVYSSEIKQDLLGIIKSSLYHSELDLSQIKNHPLPRLSNKQMKKIVVEFLYSLEYSKEIDKIESKLSRYPVIVDIFILYLRKILFASNVANSEDYFCKIPTLQLCEILIQYFDLNCKIMESLYIFYEDKIFINETTKNEMIFGTYIENDIPKTIKSLINNHLSDLEVVQQDTENVFSVRPSMENHNRSLEIRGFVSESIVFEPESQTPFFNYQSDNRSFSQSSQRINNSRTEDQKAWNTMKMSKQMSPLKMMDRAPSTNPNSIVFGNILKRTMIENQLKQSLQCKQQQGNLIDSPMTLDSPHTMFSDANFGSLRMELQVEEQIKVMKKSKSESNARMSKQIQINNAEQQVLNNYCMKKNEKIQYAKPIQLELEQCLCHCQLQKKKNMKISSNIYEINIRYVKDIIDNQPMQKKISPREYYIPSTNLDISQGYINSKGINYQWYAPKSIPIIQPQTFKKKQIQWKGTAPLDTSINSCYVLPDRIYRESDGNSKRSFSPLSNLERDRSLSPIADAKYPKTPKITFSYRNPLKYSVQLPNNIKKKRN